MKQRILIFFIVLVLAGITLGVRMADSPRVDRWLRQTLIQQAGKHLRVHVSLGEIDRNLFLTRLTLTDVTIRDLEGSGQSITAARMTVHVDPYAFIRGTLSIRDLTLEGLFLDVSRNEKGEILVEPLFPFWGRSVSGNARVKPIRFALGNVSLIDVDLSYTDRPAGLRVQLEDVIIMLKRSLFDPPDRRSVTLGAKSGRMRWKAFPEGKDVAIKDISGKFTVSASAVQVSRLLVDTGPLKIDLRGMMPLEGEGEINADMDVSVQLGKIPWAAYGMEGPVSLKGNMGGNLRNPSFRGQMEGRNIKVAGRVVEKISADIHLDPSRCELNNGTVTYRGRQVRTAMFLGFERSLPFSARLEADNYPLASIMAEVGGGELFRDGDVTLKADVAGNLSGGPADVALSGTADVTGGYDDDKRLAFSLKGTLENLALTDAELQLLWGGFAMDVAGSVSPDGIGLVIERAGGALSGLEDLAAIGSMEGELAMTGEISGSWSDPVARLDLEVTGPAWKKMAADGIQAHADLSLTEASFPMITLRSGSTALVGQLYLPFGTGRGEPWIGFEMAAGRVEDILGTAGLDLDAAGEASGRFEAAKGEGGWKGTATLTVEDGRILEEDFDRIAVVGKLEGEVFRADDIELVKDGRLLTGGGRIGQGRYEVAVETVDPVLVDGVRYLSIIRVPLTGNVSLAGKASGTLDGRELQADVKLNWEAIFYDGRPWRGGDGTFRFEGSRLKAQARLLDGDFSATARTDFRGEFPFTGTIWSPDVVDRDDINDLIGVDIPTDAVSGWIAAKADAEGVLKKISQTFVDGTITRGDMKIMGVRFTPLEELPFTYFPETGIRFSRLNLQSGRSILTGELGIAPDTGISGSVNGSVDLEGLSFLEPTVDSFVGQADIQAKVDGKLGNPLLNGSVRLSGAKCLAHVPFDLPVTELTGTVEVIGDRIHIGKISGAAGGGSLVMEGELSMAGFKPVNGSLQWKAEGVRVHFPEGLETVNRGGLSLKFSEGRGLLRGNIVMDEGVYRNEVDIDNLIVLIRGGGDAGPATAGEGGAADRGSWLGLDIGMETANPLSVDIKLLRGKATGSLQLRGTAAQPVLSGRMDFPEGTIEYRGHSFEVTSGSVGFFNPKRIEPRFDFNGRTEVTGFDREGQVREYTVELIAVGVPDKFQLDLVSSPALSEVDIVSLLTWGAVGERAFASRSGLSAAEATLLLTRELKGKLEAEVERVTGFDRFVINPSAVSSSGERTARIQVDKKLTEKVYMSYSTPILTSEEREVLLKYRISDNFSLVGEQRGEEEYGLDLDFQFEIP